MIQIPPSLFFIQPISTSLNGPHVLFTVEYDRLTSLLTVHVSQAFELKNLQFEGKSTVEGWYFISYQDLDCCLGKNQTLDYPDL